MASASMNRTLSLTADDRERLKQKLVEIPKLQCCREAPSGIIWGDSLALASRLPKKFVEACKQAGQKVNLRWQEGYDHSYFMIATFMEDHIKHHAAFLCH